jgi:hypothetical protein
MEGLTGDAELEAIAWNRREESVSSKREREIGAGTVQEEDAAINVDQQAECLLYQISRAKESTVWVAALS